MSIPVDCPERVTGDTVARWVAQTLPEAEARRFEEHLLECDRCQEAVRTATTIRAGLRRTAVMPTVLRWRRLIVPLGMAAALALVLLRPAGDPLLRLADPGPAPAFISVPVRTAPAAPGVGDRAMQAYLTGNFRRAARLLDSAATLDPTTATRFFLGVSLLKSGSAEDAAAALAVVVRDSVNPYAAEAALWLAKAWLRAGYPDSADAVLRSLGRRRTDEGIAAHARALTDSIREVRRR
jgi:putative zinc finger protein